MTEAAVEVYRPSLWTRLRWLRQRLMLRRRVADWVFWVWQKLASDGQLNLVKHAETEFRVLGWPGDDEMQGWMCRNILDLLKVFASQGHSGSSAPYLIRHFERLARWAPLGPLTGKDEEWIAVDTDMFQNRRCSDVFKKADGKAFWSGGRVFRGPDGGCYTNSDSQVPIEFPWTKPDKPEYVDVED